MQAASVGVQGQSGAQVATGYDAFQEIGISEFLKLMIAELQNQDPMNPVDNSEMLAQIGQMRRSPRTTSSRPRWKACSLANVATASSLIGRLVEGLTEDSEKIIGQVDAVTVNDGDPQLLALERRSVLRTCCKSLTKS